MGKRPSADAILSAAEGLFARRGYGETSLRELMAAARVSTTAFYARFDSKEKVLDALVARLLTELETVALSTLASSGDVERGFALGVAGMTEVLLRHRVSVRLMLTEAASAPRSRARIARAYTRLARLLGDRLGRLAARGFIPAVDGEAAGWALVGALAVQVQRWAVFEDIGDRALSSALLSTARTIAPRPVVTRAGRTRKARSSRASPAPGASSSRSG